MRKFRSGIAVIAALLPVLYCAGFVFHFIGESGSISQVGEIGLGPTVVGLSIVGLLFCTPLVFRILKLFGGPRSPAPGDPTPDDAGGSDADAVVARYLASRPADAGAGISASPPRAPPGGRPPKPAGFGRRTR